MGEHETSLAQCPDCRGKGTISAFVDWEGGGEFREGIRCHGCGGTGRVTAQRIIWRGAGKQHRDARVARMESLRDCAARLGVSAVELSDIERGRADPARLDGVSANG